MPVVTNIEDLRRIARKRIPRALFEFTESGAYDEITRDDNRAALQAIRFRQRVLVDVSSVSTATTMLGEKVAMPVAIAPTGLTGLFHRDGEILAARAAERAGLRYTMSTMSICSIEDVRAAVQQPFWFQLHVFKDRGFSEEVIARARAAGCTALFVAADVPTRGQRHADLRNGLAVPPNLTLRNAFDVLTKPAWTVGVLAGKRKTFGNIDAYIKGKGKVSASGSWINDNIDPSLSWNDIAWLRKLWPGKLVLKGVLDPDDAKKAADLGVDALVVSNHGGRQLDGAPATITVLPRIADSAGDRIEILFDGGVRSGQDVLKALSLGARGCLIGRAYLYGLAAMGEAGVTKALSLIETELRATMAFTGIDDVSKATREILFN